MLSSTFALIATAVFLAGRARAYNVYVGCLNSDNLQVEGSKPILVTDPASQNPVSCAQMCASDVSGAYGYSAWYSGSSLCDCLPLGGQGQTRADLPNSLSWVPSMDTDGTCGPDDASVWRLNTAWDSGVPKCSVAYNLVAPYTAPRSFPTISQCFTRCAGYRVATIGPVNSGSFTCRCAAGFTNAEPAICQQGSFFLYGRTIEAAASAVYRRSLKEKMKRKEDHQKKHRYCPENFTACNIEGSAGSYECMDTSVELESCGGCTFGEYGSSFTNSTGTDCTRAPGVPMGATSCIEGKCVAYACKAGWTLQGGQCVKAVGARR